MYGCSHNIGLLLLVSVMSKIYLLNDPVCSELISKSKIIAVGSSKHKPLFNYRNYRAKVST